MLGLLENGRIRSAAGKVLDCRHCVVILTSNAITSEDLAKGFIGFGGQAKVFDPGDLLTKNFPKEFLGRLDDIILFEALGRAQLERIVTLRLEESAARIQKRRIRLSCDMERLTRHLAAQLEITHTGARGVERLLEKRLLEPIAMATIKSDDDGPLDAVIGEAFYDKGEVVVRPSAERP